MLCRHVKTDGGKVKMRFNTKGGKTREVTITDRRLGRVVRKCHELPGQPLFQYINGESVPHPITSTDVNDYIREAAGNGFTAKHFRTWGATVIVFEEMLDAAEDAKKVSVRTVVELAAEALGNTVAISRKSYVHPRLIEAVKNVSRNPLGNVERPRELKWLSSIEVALCNFLKKRGRVRAQGASA